MMLPADWVFRLRWLTPLLSTWLKLPRRQRVSAVAAVLICATLLVALAHLLRINEPATSPVPPRQLSAAANPPTVATRLPALSSAALYELTRDFDNPAISQQRESFSLHFTANWHALAEFSNQLAQSNLAPQSYLLRWHEPANGSLSSHPLVTMDLQLSPGTYQGGSAQAIALPATDEVVPETPAAVSRNCHTAIFPAIIVQAAWPSRGYTQILVNGRAKRLALNDILENSWQLVRIGSESIDFRWHAASASCPQSESFTVAI